MAHSTLLAGFALVTFLLAALDAGKPAALAQPKREIPKPPAADPRGETTEQRDARMAWWRDARFGMFIHWGVYSVPAGTYQGKRIGEIGEWIMHNAKIPVADYAKYPSQFTADKFDADQWVSLAEAAGMKYIVITAKHHDGFAMFHTAVDRYNITDATPFHRDPLAELAAACKAHGIKLGFYYSQCQDWHHPGGEAFGGHWDPAQNGSFDDYLKNVAVPQVREILSNYGPVAVLWFDTPTGAMTPQRAAEFYPLLALQPQIVVNNRLGGGFEGDTETPEQHIPPQGFPGRDWETCMTINDTWGYKSYDTNFKSTETLIRNLVDIASKGGNYLLNVGPTSEGEIPEPEVQRLEQVGRWLRVNGESIYGTHPTPFGEEAGHFSETEKDKDGKPRWIEAWDWRCTARPGKLYIHLLKWPAGSFSLADVTGKVTKAYMLAEPRTALKVSQNGKTFSIDLPAEAPDKIDSVLALETSGGF
jgi:alpha-L-fucosidase